MTTAEDKIILLLKQLASLLSDLNSELFSKTASYLNINVKTWLCLSRHHAEELPDLSLFTKTLSWLSSFYNLYSTVASTWRGNT